METDSMDLLLTTTTTPTTVTSTTTVATNSPLKYFQHTPQQQQHQFHHYLPSSSSSSYSSSSFTTTTTTSQLSVPVFGSTTLTPTFGAVFNFSTLSGSNYSNSNHNLSSSLSSNSNGNNNNIVKNNSFINSESVTISSNSLGHPVKRKPLYYNEQPSNLSANQYQQQQQHQHIIQPGTEYFYYSDNGVSDSADMDEEGSVNDEVLNVSKKIKLMKLPKSPHMTDNNLNHNHLFSESATSFMIKVKTLSGKTIELTIEPFDSIQQIKERVEEIQGIPPDQQRLVFNGKTMAEGRLASSYNLTYGSVLHLVLALRGGGGHMEL